MRTLPPIMVHTLAPFALCFSRRVWEHAVELVVGALLTRGKRTVTAALRVLGLAQQPRFERDHRVLNRAPWSGLAVSRILLGLLVTALCPTVRSSAGSMRRWSAAVEPSTRTRVPGPKDSTAILYAPAAPSSSKRVGCAGSV